MDCVASASVGAISFVTLQPRYSRGQPRGATIPFWPKRQCQTFPNSAPYCVTRFGASFLLAFPLQPILSVQVWAG